MTWYAFTKSLYSCFAVDSSLQRSALAAQQFHLNFPVEVIVLRQ